MRGGGQEKVSESNGPVGRHSNISMDRNNIIKKPREKIRRRGCETRLYRDGSASSSKGEGTVQKATGKGPVVKEENREG